MFLYILTLRLSINKDEVICIMNAILIHINLTFYALFNILHEYNALDYVIHQKSYFIKNLLA